MHEMCGATGTLPAFCRAATVSSVRSRVLPPAPKVTDT
jgi:hypothetical protein